MEQTVQVHAKLDLTPDRTCRKAINIKRGEIVPLFTFFSLLFVWTYLGINVQLGLKSLHSVLCLFA
jgi:hypothetical protein